MDELSKSRSHYQSHLGRLSIVHHQVKKYYFKDSIWSRIFAKAVIGKDSVQLS